jgi:hypothetical protein
MNNLASVYDDQGKYTQAEALYGQTLEVQRRVLGPEHGHTLGTLSDFASMYQREGKYALAETYAAQTLAGWRHSVSPWRAKRWKRRRKSSLIIGSDSAPQACWAPVSRERRNMP